MVDSKQVSSLKGVDKTNQIVTGLGSLLSLTDTDLDGICVECEKDKYWRFILYMLGVKVGEVTMEVVEGKTILEVL